MIRIAHSIGHTVAVINTNHAAYEVALKRMQHLHIALVLYDGKFRQDLDTCRHPRVGINANVKTPFTVHEACYPFSMKIHWSS